MNHRPPGSLPVSKAIVGFLSFKTAEGLADRTIDSYQRQLQKWLEYLGDKDVATITVAELTQYFSWLRNEYVPHSFGGGKDRLSPKTLRNFWITLSAFFTWASKEFKMINPMKEVPSPKFKSPPVEPFTQDEMQAMLKVCLYSREVKPGNRKSFVMRLPNGYRDQAIIMTLLDTGLRAMELCSLRVKNIDSKTGKVEIEAGREGGAKGGKGRIVYLRSTTTTITHQRQLEMPTSKGEETATLSEPRRADDRDQRPGEANYERTQQWQDPGTSGCQSKPGAAFRVPCGCDV
ncbi:MAG: phage integrase N-terminal SAM-like domain-containing protein [Anaerolineales bacterium]|nr:phage integrase N-terminal SAM-like domain-containing protein [Anaerolineales bacterium]